MLAQEGSCEEQAPQIAQISKLQPGNSNSGPVPLLAPETWLRGGHCASYLPGPKGMKGLKNPRGLDALWTLSGRTRDGVQPRTPVALECICQALHQLHVLLCDCTTQC